MNRSAAHAKKLAHQAHARILKRPDLKKAAFIFGGEYGKGVMKDTQQARLWYAKAGAGGHSQAADRLKALPQ